MQKDLVELALKKMVCICYLTENNDIGLYMYLYFSLIDIIVKEAFLLITSCLNQFVCLG